MWITGQNSPEKAYAEIYAINDVALRGLTRSRPAAIRRGLGAHLRRSDAKLALYSRMHIQHWRKAPVPLIFGASLSSSIPHVRPAVRSAQPRATPMSEPTQTLRRAETHDVLEAARTWLDTDGRIALATVVGTWGSAPVGVGGQMVVAADGRFEGSVSGGCVEGEVISEAEDILASGKPKTMEFGVADETAWQVGLPCGGQIKVFIERLERTNGLPLIQRALEARTERTGLLVRTRLSDGAHELFSRGDASADQAVRKGLESGESELLATADGEVFLHAMVPPARILIIGATHIGQILAQLVKIAGYEVIVIDPRTAFAAEARFPGIRLDTEWPQDTLPKIGLDPYTAVVALAHVGHIDDEALKLAMRSPCFYVGALGSRRNHAKRVQRLAEAGFGKDEIARIHSPIGINIGAQSPQEIALSIMAELVLALRGPKVYKPA
jgi:xanthine dehydrogenase accessory factor